MKLPKFYVLDDQRQPRRAKDMIEWGQYFEYANRHVGNDTIGGGAQAER